MVQKFRRHGILIFGAAGVSTNVTVKGVTSNHNCFSGLLTNGMTDSIIENTVSLRNAAHSGGARCGGNRLVNSNNNRIVNKSVWRQRVALCGSLRRSADCCVKQ